MERKKLFTAEVIIKKKPFLGKQYQLLMIKYLVDADEHWKVKAVIEDSLKDFLQKNDAKIEKIKTSFLTYDGFINARVESVQNEIPASAGMTEKG